MRRWVMITINISEAQKTLLNCLLYNELMMIEDRITYPSVGQNEREEIVKEIFDIKDLLLQVKGLK
jgi:hypothetical protein